MREEKLVDQPDVPPTVFALCEEKNARFARPGRPPKVSVSTDKNFNDKTVAALRRQKKSAPPKARSNVGHKLWFRFASFRGSLKNTNGVDPCHDKTKNSSMITTF
jgi:hypothetical protein